MSEDRPSNISGLEAGPPLAVIVPVYGDAQATARCLASLRVALSRCGRAHALIVDDASPDPAIATLLNALAGSPGFRILHNPRNLGFAASVNRGLDASQGCDAVLLNSDTYLPPDALVKLSRHVAHDPLIGTVTPLSNNGELTSCPSAFRSMEMPDERSIVGLDDFLGSTFSGKSVDLPSGVGFCLFVSRQALAHVPKLSLTYGRGYGEDIDFTLRIADAGLRNVAALDTYVGHAGTRSFGALKGPLVRENLPKIEARWRSYRANCEIFMRFDPLASVRELIATQLAARETRHLLVTGSPASEEIAERRASTLKRRGGKVSSLHLSNPRFEARIRHEEIVGHRQIFAGSGTGQSALIRAIASLDLLRIEVFGQEAEAAIDAWALPMPDGGRRRHVLIDRLPDPLVMGERGSRIGLALCQDALEHAGRIWPKLPVESEVDDQGVTFPASRSSPLTNRPRAAGIALMTLSGRWSEPALLRQAVIGVRRLKDGPIVVFGESTGHQGLRALDEVRFTGPYASADIESLIEKHPVGAIVLFGPSQYWGHPTLDKLEATGLSIHRMMAEPHPPRRA